MNISGVSTATNYANIQSSKLTQLSSGLVVKQTSDSNTAQGSARLLQLDLSDRKGYREDYSIRDAAESLWKQETQTFNLKDLNDPTKANDIIENMRRQARWDLGLETGETKDEVMSAYIQNLRQNGLGGDVNWSGLSRELEAFKTTSPEELADGLDYLASRYVAVLDKLERNYQGEERTAQRTKLEEVYQAGKAEMGLPLLGPPAGAGGEGVGHRGLFCPAGPELPPAPGVPGGGADHHIRRRRPDGGGLLYL